jgi:hypothetical protein
MEFREDKRKYRRNGLEDECKGKDGEIDNGEDYPAVIFNLITSFQWSLFPFGMRDPPKAGLTSQ